MIVAPAARRGNRRYSTGCPRIAACTAAYGLPRPYGTAYRAQVAPNLEPIPKEDEMRPKLLWVLVLGHYHPGRNCLRREDPGDASSQRGDAVERTHPTGARDVDRSW